MRELNEKFNRWLRYKILHEEWSFDDMQDQRKDIEIGNKYSISIFIGDGTDFINPKGYSAYIWNQKEEEPYEIETHKCLGELYLSIEELIINIFNTFNEENFLGDEIYE